MNRFEPNSCLDISSLYCHLVRNKIHVFITTTLNDGDTDFTGYIAKDLGDWVLFVEAGKYYCFKKEVIDMIEIKDVVDD